MSEKKQQFKISKNVMKIKENTQNMQSKQSNDVPEYILELLKNE